MAGQLIVIEGMDGAGTTTQSRLLAVHLRTQGFSVKESAEPTKSAFGQECRRMLASDIVNNQSMLAALALGFAADRMQHCSEVIAPALAANDFVILDRYVMSSYVYQGLHLPASFVQEINSYAIRPDLVIVLDVDSDVAHRRLTSRADTKDFYETRELLKKIRARYAQFATGANTVLLDASGSTERVHQHIVHVINERRHD